MPHWLSGSSSLHHAVCHDQHMVCWYVLYLMPCSSAQYRRRDKPPGMVLWVPPLLSSRTKLLSQCEWGDGAFISAYVWTEVSGTQEREQGSFTPEPPRDRVSHHNIHHNTRVYATVINCGWPECILEDDIYNTLKFVGFIFIGDASCHWYRFHGVTN